MTERDLREKPGFKSNDCYKKGWDEKEGVVSKRMLKTVKEEFGASASKESNYKVDSFKTNLKRVCCLISKWINNQVGSRYKGIDVKTSMLV